MNAIGLAETGTATDTIARSVTRLLCDPLPYKNVLKVPHAKNLGENTVLAFSTKCTKRSPTFSRVRYSGPGYVLGDQSSDTETIVCSTVHTLHLAVA
jgi:hypothetical protein